MSVSAKGHRFSPMAVAHPFQTLRTYRPGPAAQLLIGLALALAVALVVIGPDRLQAQIEGERGIAPVATSTDIQIGGIAVVGTGKNAEEARMAGWKQAQKLAWEKLKGAPMADGVIASMVSAIVIERELIGPRRYVATLGVVFDRQRAGQYLGGAGDLAVSRSAPLLVIPVLHSGGVAQVFEVRGQWQKAWAEFNAGASAIDYVRPKGDGGDSLILTAGQPGRRSRLWWRTVLDQFGASDVIMPLARIERQWPGGPVRATFTARYGPDNTWLETFTLTAPDEQGVPAMLNQAVVRLDRIFSEALGRGLLRPDPTLYAQQAQFNAALAMLTAAQQASEAPGPAATQQPGAAAAGSEPARIEPSDEPQPAPAAVSSITVQFASPDARAVDAALGAIRGISGVRGASTSSIAIGGTSVMRVSYAGEIGDLAGALRARGWSVTVGSGAISIRR